MVSKKVVGEYTKTRMGVRDFKGTNWNGYKYMAYLNGLYVYIKYKVTSSL